MEDVNRNWATQASAWELAALSFTYPTPELAEAVALGEWADAALEIARMLGAEVDVAGIEQAREHMGMPADELLSALRADATRLFLIGRTPKVALYEGLWRARSDGTDVLLFVNPHSVEVERFVKKCGLVRAEGEANAPFDSVAGECALLEYLAGVQAGIMAVAGASSPDDLPGGSAQAAYEDFLRQHARVWLPRFAEAVAAEARIPFYRAAAVYLAALL